MLAGLCPRCGTYLQPGNHFCPSCGAAVTVTSGPSPTPVYIPGKPLPPLPPKRRLASRGVLLALRIGLLLLFCCVDTVFVLVVALNPSLLLSARGTCQITHSQVQATRGRDRSRARQGHTKAVFAYTFATPDSHTVQGQNYDWGDEVIIDEGLDAAQARVNQYQVGHRYPCWYNPLFPSFSALTRDPDFTMFDFNHTAFIPFQLGFVILTRRAGDGTRTCDSLLGRQGVTISPLVCHELALLARVHHTNEM